MWAPEQHYRNREKMREAPLLTRHTRTNGNTPISLKTKKRAPADSTLLTTPARRRFSPHFVSFLLVALVAFGLLFGSRSQSAYAGPSRIARQDSTYDVTLGRGYRF